MIRCVGAEQIVYGSDRPVVEPHPQAYGQALDHAMRVANPARALNAVPAEQAVAA